MIITHKRQQLLLSLGGRLSRYRVCTPALASSVSLTQYQPLTSSSSQTLLHFLLYHILEIKWPMNDQVITEKQYPPSPPHSTHPPITAMP